MYLMYLLKGNCNTTAVSVGTYVIESLSYLLNYLA